MPLPLVVPLAIGAGMAAAGTASAIGGIMKGGSARTPTTPSDPEYWKHQGQNQDYYNTQGEAGQQRQAAQANYDMGALDSRTSPNFAREAGLYDQLTDRNYDSAAAQQSLDASNRASQQAQALAGNARGGGVGMAAAQSALAGQQAQMQMNGQAEANQARLQELQQRQIGAVGLSQALAGQGLDMRGQDIGMQNFNAQLRANQMAQNDQYQLGMYGIGAGAANSQDALNQSKANYDWQSQMAQYQRDQATSDRWMGLGGALIGAGGGIMSMGFGGKGGGGK